MGKEYHLNAAVNRFGFNKRKYVGNLNELISSATPLELKQWEEFYFTEVHSEKEIAEIGKELFNRLQVVIIPEIKSITEKDCQQYLRSLIIDRTFDGRRTRFEILRKDLLRLTGKQFNFLPDHPEDWRFRTYRIDYYHLDTDRDLLVGMKVCPYSMATSQDPTVRRALKEIQEAHRDAEEKKAGYFFILYYTGTSANYGIQNPEMLDEIRSL